MLFRSEGHVSEVLVEEPPVGGVAALEMGPAIHFGVAVTEEQALAAQYAEDDGEIVFPGVIDGDAAVAQAHAEGHMVHPGLTVVDDDASTVSGYSIADRVDDV